MSDRDASAAKGEPAAKILDLSRPALAPAAAELAGAVGAGPTAAGWSPAPALSPAKLVGEDFCQQQLQENRKMHLNAKTWTGH